MFKFFATQSGRLYVMQDANKVFNYSVEDDVWVEADLLFLSSLLDAKQVIRVRNEDDFPFKPRRTFRTQFNFDSRRIVNAPNN